MSFKSLLFDSAVPAERVPHCCGTGLLHALIVVSRFESPRLGLSIIRAPLSRQGPIYKSLSGDIKESARLQRASTLTAEPPPRVRTVRAKRSAKVEQG